MGGLSGIMVGFILLFLNGFIFFFFKGVRKFNHGVYTVKIPDVFIVNCGLVSMITVGLGGLLIYANFLGYLERFSMLIVMFYGASAVMLVVEWVLCSHIIFVYNGHSDIGILNLLGKETIISLDSIGKV